ncbi:tRNA(Ile)-lysidine synthetase [Phialophora macrospora]|uniref:tRNA(Ile)-lysidine synthetase n=1 Tax=Phialophora macrospora TaxID=1851006 RepID=A0A0D2CFG1_9EURO|nr:tRNA(Ile)-lysidine synthetase [Phialophora macrospora]
MAHVIGNRMHNAEQSLASTARGFLKSIWNKHELEMGRRQAIPIGVCVSGGPDSMALAFLLKQFSLRSDDITTRPVAFIVNHNARKESSEEAKYVGSQLRKLEIESDILDMQWPGTSDPGSMPNFEMQARRARYRLIAEAAIRRKISHIFLGHHRDDQIETILMRLIRNSNDSFLGRQGIPEHGTIPCCEDISGAQIAIQHTNFGAWLHDVGEGRVASKVSGNYVDAHQEKTIAPSSSGIQVHRPLLAFPKAAILQFCDTYDIPYVLDQTNFNPTLTLRNAIRHLRTNYALPRALQGPSILEVQRKAQSAAKSLAIRGESILRMMTIEVFDLRSGRMTVCLSPHFHSSCEADPEAGAYALARLTSVVSPQSKDDGEPILVPQRNIMEFLKRNQRSWREQMTIQQVLLEKTENDSTNNRHTARTDLGKNKIKSDHRLLQHDWRSTLWTLSRPPMREKELRLASMAFSPPRRCEIVEGKDHSDHSSNYSVDESNKKGLWSSWLLWDHRYWIRVRVESVERLSRIRIRTYSESDVQRVHEMLDDERDDFRAMLAESAPGKSRFTIPVLTVDRFVAVFPTLNVVVEKSKPAVISRLSHHPILEWEVCYKTLDQPFIKNQVATIEWRNADLKRHASIPNWDRKPPGKTEESPDIWRPRAGK